MRSMVEGALPRGDRTSTDFASLDCEVLGSNRLLFGAEGGRAGAVDDPALDHDGDPVGDFLGEFHVLFDQQDRDAVVAQAPDHPGQLANDERRQALARLIEQQHFRIADESAGDRQHLLFAARELRPLVAGALAQGRKQLEQPRQRPLLGRAALGDTDVFDDLKSGKINRPSGT